MALPRTGIRYAAERKTLGDFAAADAMTTAALVARAGVLRRREGGTGGEAQLQALADATGLTVRCTGHGTCKASGLCFKQSKGACDDKHPCTIDGCDSKTGKCTHKPVANEEALCPQRRNRSGR